jgi:uncharacterized membrane protein
MEKETSLRLGLELIWWVFTAIVMGGIFWYIQSKTKFYPFYLANGAMIVAFLTLTRYTFQIKHSWFAKSQRTKVIMSLVILPINFVLVGVISDFMLWISNHEFRPISGHLPLEESEPFNTFIWNEMLFFGVGAVLASLAFLARLVISIWRTHNLGTA